MFKKILVSALTLIFASSSVDSACDRDANVEFKSPLYLNFGEGFFYLQGLTNGESVVMYKHPDDSRLFGQYTFKDEKCLYETVYYYVLRGKYEFTNPYITDETNFNVSNKINYVKNGANYEIDYNISPRGAVVFHNLGVQAERNILPLPLVKRASTVRPSREIYPNFSNLGKQNLKVSFLKDGENYIQFVTQRSSFSSVEGQYTFRTSDKKYHSITYEVPIEELDSNTIIIREYEISTPDNFYKTGTLRLGLNDTSMDVKYFVNRDGFHVTDLKSPDGGEPALPLGLPAGRPVRNNRPVRNRPARATQPPRALNPSFSRPELLTGFRSVQPGK